MATLTACPPGKALISGWRWSKRSRTSERLACSWSRLFAPESASRESRSWADDGNLRAKSSHTRRSRKRNGVQRGRRSLGSSPVVGDRRSPNARDGNVAAASRPTAVARALTVPMHRVSAASLAALMN